MWGCAMFPAVGLADNGDIPYQKTVGE